MRFRIIISSLLAILLYASQDCIAQTPNNWDETLDRYELLCERCLELSQQQKEGIEIPKESLSSLMVQLSMLKRSLSEARGKMSTAQKSRFDMIRRRFGNARMPREKVKETPSAARTAAIKEIPDTTSAVNQIERIPSLPETSPIPPATAVFQEQIPDLQVKAAEPVMEPVTRTRPIFLAGVQSGVFPSFTAGAMAGVDFGKAGVYVRFRHDLSMDTPVPSYSCNSSGMIEGGGRIWSDGTSQKRRMIISAGCIYSLGKTWHVYSGLGYGRYNCLVRDTDGKWADVTDLEAHGISIDIGAAIYLGRHLFAGVGAGITGLRYTDLDVSLGVRF